MNILVTGHLGYIGTVMLPQLKAQGHRVYGLDSDLYEDCVFGCKINEIPNIKKDIRDIDASDLRGFDSLIHLAALSNDPLGDFNPEITHIINHQASVRLAKLAKKVGIHRFLFSSTCSVYGSSSDTLLTEESEPNPLTPYAVSKYRAEQDISKLADEDFSPTCLRSATAYGISVKLRSDLVLNNLTAWAFLTGVVLLKSDGLAWRPIIHIEDISNAFVAVLSAPREIIHDQIFNVGITNENYQIRELAEIVKETVPDSRIEYAKDSGPDKRSYRVDFSKIFETLEDYKPKWNAVTGVKQLYSAYQENSLRKSDFEGPKYRRLKQLKKLIEDNKMDTNIRWIKKLSA